MIAALTPVMKAGLAFAYVGGAAIIAAGGVLTWRQRRPHPVLLLAISAISFSWIEAPYDWAMYAQFPPAIPRMPAWWPLDMTWRGLPASVPIGYVSYFVVPALIGAFAGRRLSSRFGWRRPITLLASGLVVGFVWAFLFNAVIGARLGVFYYGRVIGGLALWPGTRHQYPVYDALAMGVQMMLFTYILGRTDAEGRTLVEAWADSRTTGRVKSSLVSVAAVVVIGNVMYLSVFAPHLATKELNLVNTGPTQQLFNGVPNQPR